MKDFYRILGVQPDAPMAVIEAAWKAQIKTAHPDRRGGDKERAAELNEAWETLSKPNKRAAYDRQYRQETEQAAQQRNAAWNGAHVYGAPYPEAYANQPIGNCSGEMLVETLAARLGMSLLSRVIDQAPPELRETFRQMLKNGGRKV